MSLLETTGPDPEPTNEPTNEPSGDPNGGDPNGGTPVGEPGGNPEPSQRLVLNQEGGLVMEAVGQVYLMHVMLQYTAFWQVKIRPPLIIILMSNNPVLRPLVMLRMMLGLPV